MTSIAPHLESRIEKILDILEEDEVVSYKEQLTILANALMALGLSGIGHRLTSSLSQQDIVSLALEDRKKQGETVANATLLQALITLSWLNAEDR